MFILAQLHEIAAKRGEGLRPELIQGLQPCRRDQIALDMNTSLWLTLSETRRNDAQRVKPKDS
jgi:hypothetical protein